MQREDTRGALNAAKRVDCKKNKNQGEATPPKEAVTEEGSPKKESKEATTSAKEAVNKEAPTKIKAPEDPQKMKEGQGGR